jgi:AraC family ethanolamine operon transcriptional activator
VTKSERRKALLRAVEYAEELRQPIPVPELCAAAGVSQRTLEYSFEDAFGITPVKYLRWNRMNDVRRELSVAEPGSISITEAGLRWGFSELGRMAVEYQHLFDESPSATLAKPKSRPTRRLIDILPAI